jgi:MFS family permease
MGSSTLVLQTEKLSNRSRLRAVPWLSVGVSMLVMGWGGNQFTPLLVAYRERAGFSQLDVDVLLGAQVIGLVPGLLVSSSLSECFGRKLLISAGLCASLVGSVLMASGGVAGFLALFAGRTLSGIAVGIAMTVGTAWVSELSAAPYSQRRGPGSAARRSAILLTIGFAVGPACGGLLAQWASPPLVWPYLVHVALCVLTLGVLAVGSIETGHERGRVRMFDRLNIPAIRQRRFLRVVAPMAPWIFGSVGVAYAIIPQLVGSQLGHGHCYTRSA